MMIVNRNMPARRTIAEYPHSPVIKAGQGGRRASGLASGPYHGLPLSCSGSVKLNALYPGLCHQRRGEIRSRPRPCGLGMGIAQPWQNGVEWQHRTARAGVQPDQVQAEAGFHRIADLTLAQPLQRGFKLCHGIARTQLAQ